MNITLEQQLELAKLVYPENRIFLQGMNNELVYIDGEDDGPSLPFEPRFDGTDREQAQALGVLNYLFNKTSDFTRIQRTDDGDGSQWCVFFSEDSITERIVADARDILTAAALALLEARQC
jgi:hypothetical protein